MGSPLGIAGVLLRGNRTRVEKPEGFPLVESHNLEEKPLNCAL